MSNMINNSASHDATTSTCSNIVGDVGRVIRGERPHTKGWALDE
jgi:hypothetical protein